MWGVTLPCRGGRAQAAQDVPALVHRRCCAFVIALMLCLTWVSVLMRCSCVLLCCAGACWLVRGCRYTFSFHLQGAITLSLHLLSIPMTGQSQTKSSCKIQACTEACHTQLANGWDCCVMTEAMITQLLITSAKTVSIESREYRAGWRHQITCMGPC